VLKPELRQKAEELVGRYPVARSALLPLLHLVQHADGYVSDDGIAECAELLGLTKAEVMAVATFYTMYKRKPLGRHLVSVCTNFSCQVRGAKDIYEQLSAKLGVGHNETTPDGAITLEHAECLGNCDGAPVVTVDYLNYEGLTPEAASELVDAVIAGNPPPPARGPVPPGAREVGWELAGLGPLLHEEPPLDVQRAEATQKELREGAELTPGSGEGPGEEYPG
jgi:NADH-quinone oxidoreductase subunit E